MTYRTLNFWGRKEVDSRLLVVGSQTASLTPGPSFAHNLGCKCPNDQCEAIFYIYASRPFQWHQEHLNARCFGPFCRTLNIRESRRTPNPQLWKCWASPPHLAKVGLRHNSCPHSHVRKLDIESWIKLKRKHNFEVKKKCDAKQTNKWASNQTIVMPPCPNKNECEL
jgi:hypothetical protein